MFLELSQNEPIYSPELLNFIRFSFFYQYKILFVMKAIITLVLGVHTPWKWRCPSQSK